MLTWSNQNKLMLCTVGGNNNRPIRPIVQYNTVQLYIYKYNLNDQETKPSQQRKFQKSMSKMDILSNKMMIKREPVDDLDCQETKSNQNVMVQLPTFINTVEKEDSLPVPSSTVVIKRETDDDKRLECSDDEGDHKIDRPKIMLDNVLQNMFVAKEQRPTVTTSHPMTVEIPAPIDTIVYVKNYNPFPKPLLTEEISIKIESVNDLDDEITTSRQNIIGEIPPSIDPTIPIDEDADDEETDLNKNMFVAKCPSLFNSRSKLLPHVKRKHVCEVCGKKFKWNANLLYHQRTHTGEKPYQCKVCPKRFVDTDRLRIHTRTHTGERPYCCTTCGKRFSQKPALNRHYRVHTGAKPYACQFCSQTFTQSYSRTLHVNTIHLKMPAKKRNEQTNKQKQEHNSVDETLPQYGD